MIRRFLLTVSVLLGLSAPAAADFTFTQGTGATAFSFTASTGGTALCAASVTHCWANVPINTAGAALFVTGNAGLVTGTGGTFPATQSGTWNITNISGTISLPTGAATAAGISTVNTTLGSPFQAGGSIGNTTFASTQSGTWNIGTVTTLTSITNPVTVSTHAITIASGGVASGAIASGAVASGAFASGSVSSGAFASGSLAAGAMVDFLTTRQTVAAGTVASNSILAGGIYNSTPITMTNGQGAGLQFDANGYLKVNTAAGAAAGGTSSNFGSAFPTPGTAVGFTDGTNMVSGRVGAITNATAATNAINTNTACQYNATPLTVTDTRYQGLQCDVNGFVKVNVANSTTAIGNNADAVATSSGGNSPVVNYNMVWNGTTWDRQAGTTAGTKITAASAAFASGSVASGAFASGALASGSVATGAFASGSIASGAIASGAIASGAIASGAFASGAVASGAFASGSLASGAVVDLTNMSAATAAALPSKAIYLGAATGPTTGGLLTGLIQCDSKIVYDASTNGSTELVALSSGKSIYICGKTLFAGATANVKLIYGTGTACATGSNNLTPAYQFTAQTGLVDPSPFYRGSKTAVSNALCINSSAGVAVQAEVYYTQF